MIATATPVIATATPLIPATDELSEHEAAVVLQQYLPTCAYGEASYEKLIFDLPGKWVRLSARDREVSRSRPAEQKWVAALRNISAHYNKPGNAIHDGILVKRRGGGFQLASRAKK